MAKKQDEFQQQVELYKNQLMKLHRKVHQAQGTIKKTTEAKPPERQDASSMSVAQDVDNKAVHSRAKASKPTMSVRQSLDISAGQLPDQFANPEMFQEADENDVRSLPPVLSTQPKIHIQQDTGAVPVYMPDQLIYPETRESRTPAEAKEKESEIGHSLNSKPPPMHRQHHSHMQSQTDIDKHYLKNGFLQINTSAAEKALPLSGVRCVVSKLINDKKHVYYNVLTDENGQTEELALPASDSSISTSSEDDSLLPYALYHLEVMKDGFQQACDLNLPIFDGVLSIQDINMIPLAGSDDAAKELIHDESNPK